MTIYVFLFISLLYGPRLETHATLESCETSRKELAVVVQAQAPTIEGELVYLDERCREVALTQVTLKI